MATDEDPPTASPMPDTVACSNCHGGLVRKSFPPSEDKILVHLASNHVQCDYNTHGEDDIAWALFLMRGVQSVRGREVVWQIARTANRSPKALPALITRVPAKWVAMDLENMTAWEVRDSGNGPLWSMIELGD